MTADDRGQPAMLAIGVAGIGLTALWLWRGPAMVTGLIASEDGAGSEALFTVLMFAPLAVLALAGGAVTGVAAWAPGARPWTAAGRGAAIGIAGLLLAVALALIAGTLVRGTGGGVHPMLMAGLFVVAIQAGTEELLFRGWLQPLFAPRIGMRASVIVVAGVFALLHALAGGADAVALVNLLLGGLLFGLLAAHDRGIAAAAAAHVAYNAAEQLLVGLDPNPDTGGFGALFDLDLVGALRWGGSDAGLNASWAMTFALTALVVPLALRWRAAAVVPT